jgi:hypothetical protein
MQSVTSELDSGTLAMIKILDAREVAQLDPIFAEEWQAYAPLDHAYILAEVDDEELIAFIPLEDVVLVSAAYVAPNHRGRRGAVALRRIIDHLKKSAANSGRSFIMARHEDRNGHFMGLAEELGFKKYADVVYRTDKFRKD